MPSAQEWKTVILLILICLILLTGIYFSPILTGDDWETFHGAARRILAGEPLYGEKVTFAYYSNPPWLALTLLPLSLLPLRWGWAALCVLSMLAVLVVSRRWNLSLLKTALALASPSMTYILLHGQIDSLIIAGIWFSYEWWPLFAFGKPQVAIGLLFGIPRRYWIRSAVVILIAFAVTIGFFGNWPMEVLRQPRPFEMEAHNLWGGLFPFQVPVGVALILLGISRSDEKFLIAGSPFLAPYAATSSLIGPWLAASAFLKDWQVLLVWLSWWGAVVFRGLGGM